MNKLKMQSKSLVDENIEKISSLFPNCVSEGLDESGKLIKVVDFDLLKQELSDIVVEGNEERYVLNWAGKKQAILAANAPIAKTLRPVIKESVGKDGSAEKLDSENLYIEGDNLDVLKLLRETYLGKVKMIYIDPPYNTGNDFIYEDDFSMSAEEYFEKSNQIDDQGNRLFTNNDSNGRFHSDWLSMMYSRLKLAKDLLTEDGVIFISIDDNELANLQKVCDEIFGKNNFIANFIWQKNFAPKNDNKYISISTDYILCYSKYKPDFKRNLLPRTEEQINSYSNPDNDTRGVWTSGSMLATTFSPSGVFEVIAPNGKVHLPPEGRCWRYSKDTLKKLAEENRIWWGSDGNNVPRTKRFLSEMPDGIVPQNLLLWQEVGSSQDGNKEVRLTFDAQIFDFPKPIKLIKRLMNIGIGKNDIVMDFFSGSGTTAHAVIDLNAEDGGTRKFIMVQLPEITDAKSTAYKHGYKNICEIGKERIRRAGKKILEDNKNSKEPKDLSNLDIGFRVLKLDDSNMKDVYYSPSELKQETIFDIQENIKEDRAAEDLLFQVMLEMGVLLSSEIETLIIENKKVFNVNSGNLVCCFDKNLSEEAVTQIAKMKPLYAVFRDSSMSSDSVSINFDQIFETYSPTTTRKVI